MWNPSFSDNGSGKLYLALCARSGADTCDRVTAGRRLEYQTYPEAGRVVIRLYEQEGDMVQHQGCAILDSAGIDGPGIIVKDGLMKVAGAPYRSVRRWQWHVIHLFGPVSSATFVPEQVR